MKSEVEQTVRHIHGVAGIASDTLAAAASAPGVPVVDSHLVVTP
jgi:hypothetical protein